MFFDLDMLTPYIEVILPLSAIIAVMLMLVPFMGKKYVARARYWVWLIIALRLLLPFDISFTKEPVHLIQTSVPDYAIVRDEQWYKDSTDNVNTEHENTADNIIAVPGNTETGDTVTDSFTETIPENSEVTYTESGNVIVKNRGALSPFDLSNFMLSTFPVIRLHSVLANLWVYGAVLLLLYHCLRYMTARSALKDSSVHDENSQYVLNRLAADMGIKQDMNIYRCSSVGTAMIMGVFSPAIYLPDVDYSEDMLEMMLRHELMHHKRKDILYKFVLLMACCMHWYNPLVWMMDRQAQKDIEISCDEDVIRGKNKEFKTVYSDSIMSMVKMRATKRLAFSTGFANDKKTLISRFKNIYDSTVKKSGKPVIAVILALCIISTSLISCAPENADPASGINSFAMPEQAMDFIKTYCDAKNGADYWSYENFHLGFYYLITHDITIKDEHIHRYDFEGRSENDGYYKIPFTQLMDVYQFMFSEEMPSIWWEQGENIISTNFSMDYGRGSEERCTLTPLSTEQTDENSFTATFARTRGNVPLHHIQFTMRKETVDYVPEYLSGLFTSGDEIWRIESIKLLENIINPQPQTIEINSVEDFIAFAEDINTNGYYRKGNTYLLNCDLDLEGVKIEPIGQLYTDSFNNEYTDARSGFCGTFDGLGHTIKNLEIVYEPEYDGMYYSVSNVGLFSRIASEGTVKNLIIENANIVPAPDTPAGFGANNVGILAGYCSGYVDNCHVINSNVEGNAGVGGMFGHVGDISTDGGEGRRVNGYVVNCSSNATVTGCQEVAPFAGIIHFAKIVNCIASGTSTGVANPNDSIHDIQKPWRIAGFGGTVICSELDSCHANTNLVLKNTARIVGAFCATRETSSFKDCTYDKAKAGNWEIVGYEHHNGWQGTEDISDVTPHK